MSKNKNKQTEKRAIEFTRTENKDDQAEGEEQKLSKQFCTHLLSRHI